MYAFLEDVVLVDETRVCVNRKVQLWRQPLEFKVLNLVEPKTGYIRCDFIGVGYKERTTSLGGKNSVQE